MNNIVAERKASTSESPRLAESLFEICHHFALTPIPLKPKSKVPLVRWSDESWKPTSVELEAWALKPDINWGVRCGENLAVIDCDSEGAYSHSIAKYRLPRSCPVVKTGHGYHIRLKPKRPIKSQRVDDVEIKCLGSYVVAPPLIHPNRTLYIFLVALNGTLPEVHLSGLFRLPTSSTVPHSSGATAPGNFALRYCGRARLNRSAVKCSSGKSNWRSNVHEIVHMSVKRVVKSAVK